MNRPESEMGETPSPGYALLSVYDKTGLVEFARVLADAGYRLVSTGGTFGELQAAGLEVRQVSQVTGSPEILDGRVKTLHPAIHGGLLARRSEGGHLEQIAEQGITPVDVVVNNLYPFTDTVSVNGATLDEALENIDIGGPAMTRAAAKNFPDVIVVVDPSDYERIGGMIASGGVPHAERRRLAAKAFQHVALYDTAISTYLRQDGQAEPEMPAELTVGWSLTDIPRYGENPHQAGGVYSLPCESGGVANAEQLHGIGMSYLNYFDADSAWRIANGFPHHAVAIVKHANPCGLAVHEQQDEAFRRALAGDPVSAYGGIVGFNSVVTMPTVRAMRGVLFDVIAAPDYEPDALEALKRRKRTRVLRVDAASDSQIEVRTISGGRAGPDPGRLRQMIHRRGRSSSARSADRPRAGRSRVRLAGVQVRPVQCHRHRQRPVHRRHGGRSAKPRQQRGNRCTGRGRPGSWRSTGLRRLFPVSRRRRTGGRSRRDGHCATRRLDPRRRCDGSGRPARARHGAHRSPPLPALTSRPQEL